MFGKSVDIINKETGEWYYKTASKYGGQATMENAFRYCERHDLVVVGFEIKDGKVLTVWVA